MSICNQKFIQTFNKLKVDCQFGFLTPNNVMFYGAKGDGVTDDTAAFQDASLSGVNEIFIPSGTYILSATINIPTRTVFRGQYMGVNIYSSADIAFNLVGSFSSLKNIFLFYSGTNLTSSIGVQFNGTQISQLENVRFGAQTTNIFAYGIQMKATSGSNCNLNQIVNCMVTGYVNALLIDGTLSAAIGNAFYNCNFASVVSVTNIVVVINGRGSAFTSCSLSGTSTNGFNLDTNCSSNTLINVIELGTITNLIVDASAGDNLIVEPAGAGVFSAVKAQEYFSSDLKVVGNRGAVVPDATGGATVDTQARAAINALLARIRAHGLIAT